VVERVTMLNLSAAELIAFERAGLLLVPLGIAVVLLLASKPNQREATAAMVAFLWLIPALLLLNMTARAQGWWSFDVAARQLEYFPIDVWIGWAFWWGPVAVLALRYLRPLTIGAIFVAIDLVSMPLLRPLVVLGDAWLIGEVAAVVLCLAPALLAGILTRDDRQPQWRAVLHAFGWGGYLMLVIPASVLTYEGRAYSELLHWPGSVADGFLAGAALLLLFIGIAATAEFATVGEGTPIPFDPPKRVVSTGPYAFVANPMQIISALLVLLIAINARSWGLAFIAVMFALFDAVYAHWYNEAHIAQAMPGEWSRFEQGVPAWGMRWRPYVEGEAEVAISRDGPARWIWERVWRRVYRGHAVRERLLEPHDGLRLRYRRPAAGVDATGVMAAARVLEHGPLPFAMLGWLMRFAGIGAVLQIVAGLMIRWYRRP
jgi:protein-S-isoprenylcysteine O-methyltransferase Ste14